MIVVVAVLPVAVVGVVAVSVWQWLLSRRDTNKLVTDSLVDCGFFVSGIIIIILWAGVQPTLDPYAEAFIAGPLR